MKQKKLTIAIDGYSSCGKSTLAKALAEELDYIFIDTGAMYRGVTLYALKNGFIDEEGIAVDGLIDELSNIHLEFHLDTETKKPHLYLNHKNVEAEIRAHKISTHVSKIATIKQVREKLVSQQRLMGKQGGVVMDGRDVGSIIFPNAELKLFLTASIEIRTQRRFDELKSKGTEISFEEVQKNLTERDRIDSTRAEGPLIQTDDAIVIDNSNMTPEEQLAYVLKLVKKS